MQDLDTLTLTWKEILLYPAGREEDISSFNEAGREKEPNAHPVASADLEKLPTIFLYHGKHTRRKGRGGTNHRVSFERGGKGDTTRLSI